MKRKTGGKPKVRFEATIHARRKETAERAAADLDLDRIPDPKGGTRVLLEEGDLERLLEQGVEIRLLRAHPVRPLERSLIMDDEAARSWLEGETRGIERQGRQ